MQDSNFRIVKQKVHEFLEKSIIHSIQQQNNKTTNKQQPNLQQERKQIIQNIIQNVIKFNDYDTVRLIIEFFTPGKIPDQLILKLLNILVSFQGNLIIIILIYIYIGQNIKQYSNELLSKFLSTCTLIQNPKNRIIYSELMLKIYDNLSICVENQDEINIQSIEDITISIYSMISTEWISQGDFECQQITVNLIGHMVQFFPKEQIYKVCDKIIQDFITHLKKANEKNSQIYIGFNKLLEKLLKTNKAYFEHQIKSIQVQLYEAYKNPIFSLNFDSLWITNFLLQRNFQNISLQTKKTLISSFQKITFESNVELRYVIIENIFTLFNQKTFLEEIQDLKQDNIDISFMLFYLVQQASIHPQEIEDKKHIKTLPFQTTLENLKNRAQYLLQIITNSFVLQTQSLIWPQILEFIPNPSFSPGLSCVLKCIQCFFFKYKENFSKFPTINNSDQKIPKISSILVRLVILLRIPQYFKGLGVEIIKALPFLLSFYTKRKDQKKEIISICNEIEFTIMQENNNDEKKYCEKIYQLWKVLLDQFDSNEHFMNLHEDIIAVYGNYNKIQDLQVHMMKMHALILTKIESQEVIKNQMDKFVNQVYNDYSNHAINLNIDKIEPPIQMKTALADTFALIATEKIDLVTDKIRNILNSQVIQKKQQQGFGIGILGIFSKNGNDDTFLIPILSNMILALGYICIRVDSRKLFKKLEGNIINIFAAFLEKQGDEIQLNIQKCMEMISKGVLFIQNNCEQPDVIEIQKIFCKYKDVFYKTSLQNFKNSKIQQIKSVSWECICTLFKLEPAYSYEQNIYFFNLCIQTVEKQIENISFYENQFVYLFQSILYHKKLKQEEETKVNQYISVWQLFSEIIKKIEKTKDQNTLLIYYTSLLKALYEKQLKLDENEDIQHFTIILVIFLSHIYKNNCDLQKISLLCLEKIIISWNIYLDVNNRNIDLLNESLVSQLSKKMSFQELQSIVNESIQRVIIEENLQVLNGFTSLHNKFYTLKENELSDQLEKVLQSYYQVFEVQERLNCEESQKESLIEYVICLLEKNLNKGLNILLEEQVVFPINAFSGKVLKRIVGNKGLLFKTFNHLTDVVNNPEDKLFKNKGNAISHAILFIGFLFEVNNDIIQMVSKKYFCAIFGTFLLKFSTSLDYEFNKDQLKEVNSSKICFWSFQQFLKNSYKMQLLDDFSTGLQQKLIYEDSFEDGISELLMILCKNSKLQEINGILDFLKAFIQKSLKSQKSVCLIVISQLIQSTHFVFDFYDQININLIEKWYMYLINTLLQNSQDNSDQIRSIVFKGIGNITYLHKYNIALYKDDKTDLEQEFNNISNQDNNNLINEQKQYNCVKDALNSLQNLIQFINPSFLNPYLINLLQKVTINFEKYQYLYKCIYILLKTKRQETILRITSFNLYGKLLEKLNQCEEKEEYIENQLHYIIISNIVHLMDESKQIQEICKINLEKVSNMLSLQPINDILQENLSDNEFNVDFLEKEEKLMLNLISFLSKNFTNKIYLYAETLVEYTKSFDEKIKCASILNLIYIFRLLQNEQQDSQKVIMDRLYEIIEGQGEKISIIDKYIMKSTVFLIKELNNEQQ
ncbi:hypothetical protein IMG5_195480 [Ichthyophthirius multifiliis]|uniref:Maestro/Maestro-like HEAT-repeats domain-containing protein n=1 Tax=Ichthyophthirius multifiliis TaxID=5932 RepID=G0R4Y3_ICHMU|nr:hypothetical protein IMG5_195480 [Ichthyophthirius multifiliis]EGR27467.1 hypothetical protein IMG5_195480 [Ichthyophthirius multifiliis]|eukprot:XP_004024377.1 hypothetical protein IMG5_195480 [Ichthyophthirius multifiliis]